MSNQRIVVVGLGYVGLPLAIALARQFQVIGLDVDPSRIAALRTGHDWTGEVEDTELASATIEFTGNPIDCKGADIYIVTVPTPVDDENQPNLEPVVSASRTIAALLERGRDQIVIYESTVYPGVTEEVCAPVLEAESGLRCGDDFFLGYSPERINPGDRVHRVETITKVIAGQTPDVTDRIAQVYGAVTSAGVFRAASIKVAEAAKVIENAQRDINIAFMNEITQIFAKLDLSIWDVLEAAGTKWNFLPFQPGLVGGHCIGIDPYYLSFRAQQLGHNPDVILAGRATNDGMAHWVADSLHAHRDGQAGSVLMLGLTFKENVPDLRNSRVVDLIERLRALGHEVTVHDPIANSEEARSVYGMRLADNALNKRYDLVIAAVAHDDYKSLSIDDIRNLAQPDGSIADLKGIWRHLDLGNDIRRWML